VASVLSLALSGQWFPLPYQEELNSVVSKDTLCIVDPVVGWWGCGL
jgi:hypothetical protein